MPAHFEIIVRADASTPVGLFTSRLRALDQSTVFPLVLWVLDTPTLQDGDRLAILRDLESFLVRRMIAGRATTGYNKLFLSLLSNLKSQSPPSAQGFHAELAVGKTEVSEWPRDDVFKAAWRELDAYEDLGPVRVRMILLALEAAKHNAHTVQVTVHGPLSIEHVMPQDWTTHWPLPGLVNGASETSARRLSLHKFGNLTLVTPSFNSKLSNDSAVRKLPQLDQQGTLLLNRDFGAGRTTWTEQDIRDRTLKMFDLACKVWPGP